MKITDFHTHAFPDHMAERALTILQGSTKDVTAQLDGKLSSLIASMDKAGIDRSVICSIATKPSQFESILQWSKDIKSDRIVPLPSVHPEDPQSAQRVRQIAQSGFIGLKLHPYYQTFELDSEIAMPIYEAAAETGLLVLCHTGFDIAFPQDRIADPRRVAKILKLFPDMKFVKSHFLAWADWDET
ncbi:MAG: amidohydrolase family protein, partial [Lentisphaerae bacterium]|nr:amidohydrolase family protein [Lentisphaerota bacterium]